MLSLGRMPGQSIMIGDRELFIKVIESERVLVVWDGGPDEWFDREEEYFLDKDISVYLSNHATNTQMRVGVKAPRDVRILRKELENR